MSVIFSSYHTPVIPVTPIVLQNEAVPIAANYYAVAGVQDLRTEASAIAHLISDGPIPVTEKADVQGGALHALRNFIQHNVSNGNNLRQVVIGIKQLKISETLTPDKKVSGKITLELSFGLKHTDDTVSLVTYKGGMQYMRPVGNRQVIEPSLRRSLVSALTWFNIWMSKQVDHNPLLATAVKLKFRDCNNNTADTIYYNINRPLNWDDFKDKARSSRYTAEVFPGFGFDEDIKVERSTIYIDVALKVYIPKSACWVKPDYRTDEVLSHEQRHFDIVKIISERYKQQLLHTPLPVENYDGALHALYFDYMHEMNVMQDAYDGETRHGQDTFAQAQWNRKIQAELHNYGIEIKI
ncbi:hypothetical protein [Mucilaginibacter koreensis]